MHGKNQTASLASLLLAGVSMVSAGAMAQTPPPSAAQVDPMKNAVSIEQLVQAPAVTLTNGQITAKVYLPDTAHGFYRGTRFDWAGVIGSLTYRGHDFYVPWFQAMSPDVQDYVFDQGRVVASANTAATGPVEEFNGDGGALGYAQAAPGGTFVKIGVGVLRRPDDSRYSAFRTYPLVDAGTRTHTAGRDRVTFTHEVTDTGSGYAYHYTKTLRLLPGSATLLIEHELRNTGKQLIATSVYDHNFLNIDGSGTTAGMVLSTPFALIAEKPPAAELVNLAGTQFTYRAAPAGDQRIMTGLGGFGATAGDYNFHVSDPARGASVRISADQPLDHVVLWSIRPVMAIEPFIKMTIAPGQTFRWTYRYAFEATDSVH